MIDLKYDESAVEELKARLRDDIAKEQIALHEQIERLKAYRDDAQSDREYDDITQRMKAASNESYARIEPVRRELDGIIKAQVSIRSMQPVVLFVPADTGTAPSPRL